MIKSFILSIFARCFCQRSFEENLKCSSYEKAQFPFVYAMIAWDGKEAAQVGEGEEGGPVGGAEPGDPSLAGEAVLPMKLRVYRLGICLLVSVQLLL